MATRAVSLDGTHPSIRYSGQWVARAESFEGFGNFGVTYNSTVHETTDATASFSLTYYGSRVWVYGSNPTRTRASMAEPAWECLIDGIDIGIVTPFEFAENNWQFCNWNGDGVTEGEDTLTVNIKSSTIPFRLDAIRYTPSPGTDVDGASVIVGQDDISVVYGTGWSRLGEFHRQTTTPGARMAVDFTGTRVTWMGQVPGSAPAISSQIEYTIDDQAPVVVDLPGYETTMTLYEQVFFQTPVLPNGPHRLSVTHRGSSASTPLVLGHMFIDDGNYTVPNLEEISTDILDLTTGTPTSTSQNGWIPNGSPSSSPSPPSTSDTPADSSKAPVGAIVGGVLGGLAFLCLLIVAAYYMYSRRKLKDDRPQAPIQHDGQVITQFNALNPPGTRYSTPAMQQSSMTLPSSISQSSNMAQSPQYVFPPPIVKDRSVPPTETASSTGASSSQSNSFRMGRPPTYQPRA